MTVLACSAQAHAISLTISNGSAVAGGRAEFAVSIQGVTAGGAAANNAQLDVLFDTSVFYVPSDARRACQVSPSLAQLVHTETLPASPVAPAGMQRLRLSVIDTIQPLGDISDGDFYFCSLDVREDAPAGPTKLTGTRQNVGDTAGNVLQTSVGTGIFMITSQGAADAIQPRGSGGGAVPGAPALDIPAQAGGPAARAEDRPAGSADTTSGSRPVSGGAGGQLPTPVESDDDAAAVPKAGSGSETGVGQRALEAGQATAGAAAPTSGSTTVAETPTVKPSEGITPKATSPKVVTPTAKAEVAKKAEAPPVAETSGGCEVTVAEDYAGMSPLLIGMTLWLWRRRLP